MTDERLDAVLARGEDIVFARSSPEDKLRIATRARRGPRRGDDRRRRQRRPGTATGRHRRRDGAGRHRRRARGGDDGAHRRRLRDHRARRRGGSPRLRRRPQVHRLHLCPRRPRRSSLPRVRAVGGRGAAGAHGGADPRHRPRDRDAAGARAGPRAGGARPDGEPAARGERADHHRGDAAARLGRPGHHLRRARARRLPLGPAGAGWTTGRPPARHAAARGLPAGHHRHLRRHRRLPGRHRSRVAHRARLPALRRAADQPVAPAGIAFELAVRRGDLLLPRAQAVLGTRPPRPPAGRAAPFPVVVWAVDAACAGRPAAADYGSVQRRAADGRRISET